MLFFGVCKPVSQTFSRPNTPSQFWPVDTNQNRRKKRNANWRLWRIWRYCSRFAHVEANHQRTIWVQLNYFPQNDRSSRHPFGKPVVDWYHTVVTFASILEKCWDKQNPRDSSQKIPRVKCQILKNKESSFFFVKIWTEERKTDVRWFRAKKWKKKQTKIMMCFCCVYFCQLHGLMLKANRDSLQFVWKSNDCRKVALLRMCRLSCRA